jgi:hypothetical protein
VVVVPDVPSPSPASGSAFQIVYPQGHPSGYDASRQRFAFPAGVREFYASIAFRPDPNWHVMHAGSNMGTKLFHIWNGDGHRFVNYILTTEGSEVGAEGWLQPNQGITRADDAIPAGEWAVIEMRWRLNDPGQANGVVRWWVNGHLIGDYTNVEPLSGDGSENFSQFVISGTWGGGVPNKTKDEWLQYGQVYISRAP